MPRPGMIVQLALLAVLLLASPAVSQRMVVPFHDRPGGAFAAGCDDSRTIFVGDGGEALFIGGEPLLDWAVRNGYRRAVFVVSHSDKDHTTFLEQCLTRRALQPFEQVHVVAGRDTMQRWAERSPDIVWPIMRDVELTVLDPGMTIRAPLSTEFVNIRATKFETRNRSPNHESLLVQVELAKDGALTRFFYPGDAPDVLLRKHVDYLKRIGWHPDVYGLAHHGSRLSSFNIVADAFDLDTAVVFANENNRHLHPAPEILRDVVSRLGAERVFCTGTGEFTIDQNGIEPLGTHGLDALVEQIIWPEYQRLAKKASEATRARGVGRIASDMEALSDVRLGVANARRVAHNREAAARREAAAAARRAGEAAAAARKAEAAAAAREAEAAAARREAEAAARREA
ncbi:hypothetical protein OAX78_02010, partial [Planctomycetota bacterium]|nr:hypothetical protein [Planctomycetota bacterium]